MAVSTWRTGDAAEGEMAIACAVMLACSAFLAGMAEIAPCLRDHADATAKN